VEGQSCSLQGLLIISNTKIGWETPRISSNLGNAIIDDRAFAPFGEIYDNFGSTAANENIFTGDSPDILGTGDCCFDTPNRELSANQGRWLSPDPADLGAVDFSNPQSWNRYAYVNNSPLNYIDPSGQACYPLEKQMFGSCSGFLGNGVNFGANWNEFWVAFGTFWACPPGTFPSACCWSPLGKPSH
jgi:RHS repeat-associated protein